MRMRSIVALLGLVAASLSVASSCDEEELHAIVIGTIFHDDISEAARLRLQAVQLAVEEVNAAGVFEQEIQVVNLSPNDGGAVSTGLAQTHARALHDDHDAVAVISLFSSIGQAIIEVTNDTAYSDLVQCNVSATSPALNVTATPTSDQNDAFFRTVVNDNFQGALLAQLVQENGWDEVGVYNLDDPYGQGLRTEVLAGIAGLGGVTIEFDDTFPAGAFVVGDNLANLNQIIALTGANDLDALIIPALAPQASIIVDYLTSNGYEGALLLSDGGRTGDMFTVATNLSTWLGASPDNLLIGTQPNNYGGANSAAFTTAFMNRFGEGVNSFSSTAYDCAMAIMLSLLYEGQRSQYEPEHVKDNISRFKDGNRVSDEVTVGIGTGEVLRTANLVRTGERIDFEGASGQLLFANDGDRKEQGMLTFGPNAGVDDWATVDLYDAKLNKL